MQSSLANRVKTTDNGELICNRNYRLDIGDSAVGPVYAVGVSEPSHGLTATLISNMAVRSGEIISDLSNTLSREYAEVHHASL